MIQYGCKQYGWVVIIAVSLVMTSCDTTNSSSQLPVDQPGAGNPGDLQYVVFKTYEGKTSGNDRSFLYKVREDGSGLTAVATSGRLNDFRAISPSGRIVYQNLDSFGQHTLYSVAADDSPPVALLSPSQEYRSEAVTPDDHVILKRELGSFPQGGDLHSVPADGSAPPVALANTADTENFFAVTSGSRVIFVISTVRSPINSINADGSGLVTLVMDSASFPHITPDGHVIYSKASPGVDQHLYSLLADGSGPIIPLDETPNSNKTFVGTTADNRVIYELITGVGRDLWIVNPDGSGRVRLTYTPDREYFAAVIDDGRIIFETVVNNQRDLYIINGDGTGLVPLATSTDDERFAGAYKNERIVYRRVVNQQGDLYSVKPDGSGIEILANKATEEDTFKAITRAGRVIYETIGVSLDIYAVNLDGTGTTPLAVFPQHDIFGGLL